MFFFFLAVVSRMGHTFAAKLPIVISLILERRSQQYVELMPFVVIATSRFYIFIEFLVFISRD